MDHMKNSIVLTTLLGGVVFSSFAQSADFYVTGEPNPPTVLPAVSGLNGKLAIEGGALDESGFGAAAGSITAPLGQRFGIQLDGSIGILEDEFAGGVAGHLFWRDPAFGLLGLFGSYTATEYIDGEVTRLGVEGEYYWNQFTLKSVIGAEFVDIDPPISYDETNLFAFTDLSYYAMDDLELSIGHRYTGEKHAVALGVEYQLEQQLLSSGVALFAEARIGEDDYQGAWAGVRMYFGDDKSLIRRHREDDPTDWSEDSTFGAVNGASNGPKKVKKEEEEEEEPPIDHCSTIESSETTC